MPENNPAASATSDQRSGNSQSKTKGGFFTLLILSAVPLIMVLGNSMLIPVLPTMESKLHISHLQASLVITLFSVPAGIVIPFAGYLSDQIGRRAIIAPALLLYGLGGIIAGLAAWFIKSPYTIIMVGRVIQGIGAAGTAPIVMALISDLFQGNARSRVLGINEASNGFGKVISPILGAAVAFVTWYAAFFVFPFLCIPAAICMWFFIKEPKAKGGQKLGEYIQSTMNVLKREMRWLFTAYFAGAVALFVLFGVLFYLSQILEDTYKIDGIKKGLILAIPLLAMCITSYVTGRAIKKKVGLMKMLIVTGLAIVGGTLAAAAFFTSAYVLLGLLVIAGVGTGLVLPCLNTLITSAVSKEKRGIVTSLYGSVRFWGVAIGPPIFSWLMGISSVIMFVSVAVLAFIGSALCLVLIHAKESNKEGPQSDDARSPKIRGGSPA